MSKIERWGTYSVKDFMDSDSLIADILLYDRLVIPVPSDEETRRRWIERGRNIDQLYRITDRLNERNLVEEVKWKTRVEFEDFFQTHNVTADIKDMIAELKHGQQLTRRILADKINFREFDESSEIVAVSAYHSENDFENDQFLDSLLGPKPITDSSSDSDLSNLCLVAQHYIGFPNYADREDILKKAIDLAGDQDFKEKRRNLYNWQEEIIRQKITVKEAKGLMDEMILAYDKKITDAKIAFTKKMVNTFIPIGQEIGSGLVEQTLGDTSNLIDTPNGDVKITKTIKKASSPEQVDQGPLAMFYTIDKALRGNWFEKVKWKVGFPLLDSPQEKTLIGTPTRSS